MTDVDEDPVRAGLEKYIGKPMGDAAPVIAPDEVNLPMIRHWVAALDDRNPVYTDEAFAATTRFGGVVDDLQAITQPLNGGACDKDGTFKGISRLAIELIGDGRQ